MGDDDDGFSLVCQVADNGDKLLNFRGGQHGRGFIKNEDLGTPVQGF